MSDLAIEYDILFSDTINITTNITTLLKKYMDTIDLPHLKLLFNYIIVNDSYKNILKLYIVLIKELNNKNLEVLLVYIIEQLKVKIIYYSEEYISLVILLGEIYIAQERFYEISKLYSSFDVNSIRNNNFNKIEWIINTAFYFIFAKDCISASTYVNLAYREINSIKNPELLLKFKMCQATVLDNERRFLDASMRYLELARLSSNPGMNVDEESILKSYENAITCAILAKAGTSRTRIFGMLYKEERTRRVPNFASLEKMVKERIVRPHEIEKFVNSLEEHHKATLASGMTVFKFAITQHNMLCVSKIYKNIRLSELSKLLDISLEQTEEIASTMIREKRLKAKIDQVEDILVFEGNEDSLAMWDNQIASTCLALNDVIDKIQKCDSNLMVE